MQETSMCLETHLKISIDVLLEYLQVLSIYFNAGSMYGHHQQIGHLAPGIYRTSYGSITFIRFCRRATAFRYIQNCPVGLYSKIVDYL